jgi:anthraniloyl-CoA monooxygenase
MRIGPPSSSKPPKKIGARPASTKWISRNPSPSARKLFAERLDGNPLISNAKHLTGSAVWLKFNRVLCEKWHHKNIVLIGDAAHTAHFSIGSGTKLAMEDAMSLARVLLDHTGEVCDALQRYQDEREIEALKLQSAARNRMEWFEQVERYVHLEPEQFTYSLLTGSQRIGHENLKLRDSQYVNGVEKWFAARSGIDRAIPPMFTTFSVRGVSLKNRVIVSPMATYMATTACPTIFIWSTSAHGPWAAPPWFLPR